MNGLSAHLGAGPTEIDGVVEAYLALVGDRDVVSVTAVHPRDGAALRPRK